jgi:hypothetical protein
MNIEHSKLAHEEVNIHQTWSIQEFRLKHLVQPKLQEHISKLCYVSHLIKHQEGITLVGQYKVQYNRKRSIQGSIQPEHSNFGIANWYLNQGPIQGSI